MCAMSKSDWLNTGVALIAVAIGFLAGGPICGFSLLFVGVVFVVHSFLRDEELPQNNDLGSAIRHAPETLAEPQTYEPDLIFATFSTDYIAVLGKSVFLLHFRNDATSPLATAKKVVAHIGYRQQSGNGMNVDYGAWMEDNRNIDIERGQTRRLIVALVDEGKNLAVNFTGPRTEFRDSSLVPIGEITVGQWMVLVRLNAENYERVWRFLFTVEADGKVGCRPTKQLMW